MTKSDYFKRAVEELNLDTSDTFTLLFANASALLDQRDELKAALKQAVKVIRVWHAMPQKPGDDDAFDLYYNHSPEMKPIRDALGNI